MEKRNVCSSCFKYHKESQDLNETFHYTVKSNHGECMQRLIDKGADVNNVNTHGDTPLMIAA